MIIKISEHITFEEAIMTRRIITVAICIGIIISISSCSSQKSKWSLDTKLNILVFDGGDPMNTTYALEKYDFWEEKFNEMFNENVNLEARFIKPWGFVVGQGDQEFETEIQDMAAGGIVLMSTNTYHSLFAERENYFEPLDAYIEDSDLHLEWPKSLIEYGEFPGDNKTWCLPTQFYSGPLFRAYNKNILNEMGLSKPTTIEDFTLAIGQYYMDYNKPAILLNPESKGSRSQSASLSPLSDIFALGGISALETIIYDHSTQRYRNIIDIDETKDILYILKDLYESGAIGLDNTVSSNKYWTLLNEEKLFSALVRGPSSMIQEDIVFSNFDLETQSLVTIDREQVSYIAVVLKGTENIEEVLNKFIDSFLKPGEKYIAASRGFEGIHYEKKDELLIPMKYPQYKLGAISQFSSYFLDQFIKDKERDDYIEFKEAYLADQHLITPNYLDRFLVTNVFLNSEKSNAIQDIFSDVFIKIFTEDNNVEDLINEYREECHEMGVVNYVDEANFNLDLVLEGSVIE